MCGIVGIFNIQEQTEELRKKALRMSQKIRHRGPDWSGIYCGNSAILAHERLSIVDPESGRQPLFSPDYKQVLAVNGEIYNHVNIRQHFDFSIFRFYQVYKYILFSGAMVSDKSNINGIDKIRFIVRCVLCFGL